MRLYVLVRAKVREQYARRPEFAQTPNALAPRLYIHVRWRGWGNWEGRRWNTNTADIADERESSRWFVKRDVMGGVPRRVDHLEGPSAKLQPVSVANDCCAFC